MVKPQIISVDIDGTLARGASWTPEDCLRAKPIKKMIELVNKLYKKNFIIIHTARRHDCYHATIRWLEKYGVKYHAIKMEKMPAHIYIDDRAVNLGGRYKVSSYCFRVRCKWLRLLLGKPRGKLRNPNMGKN